MITEEKEKNIDIITTNLTGRDTPEVYAAFELSEDGKRVIHCANGCTPKKSSYNAKTQQCSASFLKEQCVNCPSEEYKNYARLSNGIETIPSVLRRNYNVDHLPRGWQRG